MKRKFSALVAMLVICLFLVSSVQAAPNTMKGISIANAASGLRGIASTLVGTGSPPAFTFTAKSPDVYQAFFSMQMHPNNSCLQPEIYHERLAGAGQPTAHYFEVYSWCSPYQVVYKISLTDSTFRGKYVRTNTWNDTGMAFQDENLDVRVYNTTGTTWVVQLYNYNTSSWDTIVTKSGTNTVNTDVYIEFGDAGYTEDSPGAYCPTLYPWGIAQVRGIQRYTSGVWTTVTASDVSTTAIGSMPCFDTLNQYTVSRPNPWQFRITPTGVGY